MNSTLPNPTPQGQDIIQVWNSDPKSSLMVVAYAGCGKTTLLRQIAPHIKEDRVLAVAFNKKNADDFKGIFPTRWDCATMNSIGHRALGKTLARRPFLDTDKLNKAIKAGTQQAGIQRLDEETYSALSTLIRMARTNGLMPSAFPNFKTLIEDTPAEWERFCDMQMITYNQELVEFARAILIQMIRQAMNESVIDFDDQIYLSVLANGAFEKYQTVIVDEAQDLSPMNHIQVRKSLMANGRLIVVGDPKQAIYAFRGASSKSMPELKSIRPDTMREMPLSLTFRCSKLVVQRNVSHAPGFEAAPGNKDGRLIDLTKREEWSLSDLPDMRMAILCRNNAPLLATAFRLIASGRGVTMLGRDIGKTLISLLKKIAGEKLDKPLDKTKELVVEWRRKELDLAAANDKQEKMSQIEDRADSLLAVIESCYGYESLESSHEDQVNGIQSLTARDVERKITSLFEDQSGLITLGTGHRAKGLEWPMVVHLDPWRIPSRHAKTAQEHGDLLPMEQELNLKYVIETRSQDVLVLANVKGFEP